MPRYSKEAVDVVRRWWEENSHRDAPPSKAEKKDLAEAASMTVADVSRYLRNKRHRAKKHVTATRKLPRGTRFPQESVDVLRGWLEENRYRNATPSDAEKKALAETANMTVAQVSTWFRHARSRKSGVVGVEEADAVRPDSSRKSGVVGVEEADAVRPDSVITIIEIIEEEELPQRPRKDLSLCFGNESCRCRIVGGWCLEY